MYGYVRLVCYYIYVKRPLLLQLVKFYIIIYSKVLKTTCLNMFYLILKAKRYKEKEIFRLIMMFSYDIHNLSIILQENITNDR